MALSTMRDAIEQRVGKLANLTGLHISEVFYGLGGLHELLWTGGLRPQLVNSYEVEPIFEKIHEAVDKVRCSSVSTIVKFGAVKGDVMKVRVGPLERSRAIVGGPPCGPWAAIGQRKKKNDTRASCYDQMIDWVDQLARAEDKEDELWMFAFENSDKIMEKNRVAKNNKKRTSYAEDLINKMNARESIRSKFLIDIRLLSLKAHIDHHRDRAWLRGLNKKFCTAGIPDPIASFGVRVKLNDILDPLVPNVSLGSLSTQKMKDNVRRVMERIAHDQAMGVAGDIAVFDISRNPATEKYQNFMYDCIPSLRTKGPYYFVVSVAFVLEEKLFGDDGEVPDEAYFFRYLTESERYIAQGLDPVFHDCTPGIMNKRLGTGNAYAIPMVASATLPLLEAISEYFEKQPRKKRRRVWSSRCLAKPV